MVQMNIQYSKSIYLDWNIEDHLIYKEIFHDK